MKQVLAFPNFCNKDVLLIFKTIFSTIQSLKVAPTRDEDEAKNSADGIAQHAPKFTKSKICQHLVTNKGWTVTRLNQITK